MTILNNNQNPTFTTMEQLVIKERLRQARLSFNIALSLTIISAIISVTGVGLLLSGKTSEGTATTAGGLASKIVSVGLLKMTKDTNERLDKIAMEFQDED
ncbi:TRADD-N-associated membrane domain-containing protein [Dapis sp. BLCC M126]|uniref:TRADD-N-associated membrane domain-containing protein n=1 Tax=Dapis sp. BLCC M126 TaxID=3400189 RepID=UPI003CF9FDF4